MFSVSEVKNDFPIFKNYKNEAKKDLVYLDSAASSQTPRQVVEAMNDYYFKYRSNIHRSAYEIGEIATDKYEEAREVLAKFINAEVGEVIFTGGATISSNMLIYALEQYIKLEAGDEILTSIAEHHSNLIPLQELAKRKDLKLNFIDLDETGLLSSEGAEKLITPKTKIVSIALVSNVLGTIYDISKVREKCREVGAVFILDATKATGHIKIDTKALDCDFLFFSGHKMLGPTGIGVLWGKSEHLEKMNPSFFGGGMVEDATKEKAKYTNAPSKFEPGTPNIAGAIGLSEAVKYIEKIGLDNIQKHSSELVSYAIEKLSDIPEVGIFSEKDSSKNAGIISFDVSGIHPHDLGEILSRNAVALRGGHHCAMPLMKRLGVPALNRASFYLYNDRSDIDALVAGINKAKEIFT